MNQIGSVGNVGGSDRKQLFQEAKSLAPSNQNIQQDLNQLKQAHEQAEAQGAQGMAQGQAMQGGGAATGTQDQSALSSQAQGISAAGSTGMSTQQRQQMHGEMAPYIQKLTQDVQTAMSSGANGGQQQQQAQQTQQTQKM